VSRAPKPSAADEAIRAARRESQLTRRTFLVAGPQKVQGKEKGEEVELEMTPDQIDVLLKAGVIAEKPRIRLSLPVDEIKDVAANSAADPGPSVPNKGKGK